MYDTVDLSDIPLTKTIPDEDDLVDDTGPDEEAIRRELEDKSPSPQQKGFIEAGGWLAPESDRTDSGGIPLGMPVDKVDGQKIKVVRFSENGSTTLAEYAIDGMSDPVVREVFTKYAVKEGEAKSPAELSKQMIQAMQEVQRIKSQRANAGRKSSSKPEQQQGTRQMSQQRTVQRVEVVFDFGGVDGARRARYSDAYVSERFLVLVADERMVDAGVYEPPDLGPATKIQVTVAGHPEPYHVFSCGLKHGYDGNMFYLLFLDS